MIDYINTNLSRHIITIEDPIEFVHPVKKCVIVHREVGGGIRIEEIGARLELAVDEVSPVILALKQRDYVLVVDGADTSLEIVPARPLDQITVGEIWSVPDADGLHAGDLRESAGTSLVEGVLRRAREGATAEMKATFEAILLEERAAANLKALRPAGP